jgi:hypothetical protein
MRRWRVIGWRSVHPCSGMNEGFRGGIGEGLDGWRIVPGNWWAGLYGWGLWIDGDGYGGG